MTEQNNRRRAGQHRRNDYNENNGLAKCQHNAFLIARQATKNYGVKMTRAGATLLENTFR